MYNLSLIETKYESNSLISNGLDAMSYVLNCDSNLQPDEKLIDNQICKEIVKYNLIDCKVMQEILNAVLTTS